LLTLFTEETAAISICRNWVPKNWMMQQLLMISTLTGQLLWYPDTQCETY
jgi:hypothetical protein